MDVIAHQAIAEDLEAILGGIFPQKSEVFSSVGIDKEYILLIITALGDMVRKAG